MFDAFAHMLEGGSCNHATGRSPSPCGGARGYRENRMIDDRRGERCNLRTAERVITGVTVMLAFVFACAYCQPRLHNADDANPRHDIPACTTSTMSLSRGLRTRDGYRIYVEAPEVVATPRGIFLIGSPTLAVAPTGKTFLSLSKAPSSFFSGAIVRDSLFAELMTAPAGVALMNAPRATVTPTGAVELLWMPTDSTGLVGSGKTLFWSRWTGAAWSPPQRVPGTVNPGVWDRTQTSRSVYAVGVPWILGAPELAAVGLGRSFVWTRNGWLALSSDGAFGPHPSVAPSDDSVRTLAHIAYGAPDGNAVFASRSLTSGRTWLPAVRVSPPGSGAADWPQLLRIGGGQLALVWASGLQRVGGAIQLAISTDQGASWVMQTPYALPKSIVTLRAIADHAGRIHVILELGTPSLRTTQPFYVQWGGRRWRNAWAAPDSTESFGIATIDLGGDATTVIATWGENDRRSNSSETKMMSITTSCNR